MKSGEQFAGGLLGHPRGLATLFFTEMWERCSYYGMRALLVLFMTESVASMNPGLGFNVEKSTAIYGLYTSGVYLLALPGGWIADKLWGQRKAVFVGGCIIAAGHFSLAVPTIATFYLGLVLIAMGTGLLKPNVSTMVGELYPEGGARRDAGFSIFYMGINLGAFLGPSFCGLIGEGFTLGRNKVEGHFHWGFALAGIGMIAGLIQYALGGKHLGSAGLLKTNDPPQVMARRSQTTYIVFAAVAMAVTTFGFFASSGALPFTIRQIAEGVGWAIGILSGLFFLYLFVAGGLNAIEKKRLVVIVWLYLLSALFWAGYEQAGSSMNLFARDLTDRVIFGWETPTSWLQNVNPFFIIVFAPVFGWLWTWLAARNRNPSLGVKFAYGMLGLAAGFFVLSWGAANATVATRVSMTWLVVTYFLHTVGELCLSPVGLSSMTKLAPAGRVGQMMGVWFIATALGNLFAGLVAGRMEQLTPAALFWDVATVVAGAGIVALLVSPVVKRLTAGVE